MYIRLLRTSADALGKISGALIAAIALITVVDVLGRLLFQSSLQGSLEVNLLLMVSVAFLGLAAAEWDGRHVEVTLIVRWLRGRTATLVSAIRILVIVAVLGTLIFASAEEALSSFSRNEFTSGVLGVAMWPTKAIITVSLVLYLLSVVAKWSVSPSALVSSDPTPNDSGE